MNLHRLWAHFAVNPTRLNRLRTVALGMAVISGGTSGVSIVLMSRINRQVDTYRAQALAPREVPTLSPEEEALYAELTAIYEGATQSANPQAYAISMLNDLAQREQLSVLAVETGEVPDDEPTPNGWRARLLRFRLAGSSAQLIRWLVQIERVPLVIKMQGVQMEVRAGTKGVSATAELEVLLPPLNKRQGETAS